MQLLTVIQGDRHDPAGLRFAEVAGPLENRYGAQIGRVFRFLLNLARVLGRSRNRDEKGRSQGHCRDCRKCLSQNHKTPIDSRRDDIRHPPRK
jgi:hypothetical protein